LHERFYSRKGDEMNNQMLELLARIRTLTLREEGQDLVEYGLLVALIAFGVISGLKSVSTDISMIYSAISSTVSSSIG
jgi:Flp pilus assembly pilin Flp